MPSTPSSSKPIVITKRDLSDANTKKYGEKPIDCAMAALEKIVGPEKLEQAKQNPQLVHERAVHHYATIPTHRGDEYLLERVCMKAIEDIANKGSLDLFRLSFPHIELHVCG